jgi:hypothetical protein
MSLFPLATYSSRVGAKPRLGVGVAVEHVDASLLEHRQL